MVTSNIRGALCISNMKQIRGVNISQSIENNMDGNDYQRESIEKDGNRQRNSATNQDEETTISMTSYNA